jgi:hypothetical protein
MPSSAGTRRTRAPARRRSRSGSSRARPLPRTAAHRLRLPTAAGRRLPCRLPGGRQRLAPVLAARLGRLPADHTRQARRSLRAVIGGFHDKRLEEYRIGFGPRDERPIFHGVVWPLLGSEDETTDVTGEVEAPCANPASRKSSSTTSSSPSSSATTAARRSTRTPKATRCTPNAGAGNAPRKRCTERRRAIDHEQQPTCCSAAWRRLAPVHADEAACETATPDRCR